MSYEIPNFDPTSQHEDPDIPFGVWHGDLNHVKVHLVHPEEMYRRFESGQKITLADYDNTDPKSVIKHVTATGQGGENYLQQPATLYSAAIDLTKEKDWKEAFVKHADNTKFTRLAKETFVWSNSRLLRRPDTLLVMQADIYTRRLELRNQTTSTNANDPLKQTRLCAPNRSDVKNGGQLVHVFDCLSAMLCVANSLNKDKVTSPSNTLIVTPDGPLYKNPDTGQYVHHLGHEKITIKNTMPKKAEPITRGFDQFFGIDHIIEDLRPLLLFYTHPDLAAKWHVKRPGNVLLYGHAGTGKTQLVHALAHEIGADLYELSSAEIYGKWLGDSEKAMKAVFDKVRKATKPTILLLDEMDSIINIVDNDSGGGSRATNAVAGIFKTESAKITEQNPNVILAATTNDPERLDPALIRAGRFDVRISMSLPDDQARAQIFGNLILNYHTFDISDVDSASIGQEKSVPTFNPYSPDLHNPTSLKELADLTDHDFSSADIIEVLRRATIAKADEEARTTQEPKPIDLGFLRNIILSMRQNRT